jgi:hypothetical protein
MPIGPDTDRQGSGRIDRNLHYGRSTASLAAYRAEWLAQREAEGGVQPVAQNQSERRDAEDAQFDFEGDDW